MNNPCKDCLSRHSQCAVNCHRWNTYVKWRNDMYEQRMKQRYAEQNFIGSVIDRKEKLRRERHLGRN